MSDEFTIPCTDPECAECQPLSQLSLVSEYGETVGDVELVRSWAETWVSAWWQKPGQGRVFALVPVEQVAVVATRLSQLREEQASE